MAWPIGFDQLQFEEAVQFFLEKVIISKADFEALTASARAKAFTVADVAQLDVVTDVWRAVDTAIADGTTLETFRESVKEMLDAAWGGTVEDPPWRIETVFRTNVQNAYAAGRYEQATVPSVAEDRTYWMFDAILDSRTTSVCKQCDGTVLPSDDPWWKTHLPPLHFNCRSTFITLTDEQAEEMGVTTTKPKVQADDGFGAVPDRAGSDWEPAAADYPDELWAAHLDRTGTDE